MLEDEKEVLQWLEVFTADREARLRAATELGLIGIRHRKQGRSIRGDLEKTASGAFSEISPRSFVDFLEETLSDQREQVQCEAIFALGELAGEEVIGPLLKQLDTSPPDSKLHTAITRALSKIGGPEVKNCLFGQSQNENTMRGIVGLVVQHKAEHEAFSREFHAPRDRAARIPGMTPPAVLAVEVRERLEKICDEHRDEYVGLLAEQLL